HQRLAVLPPAEADEGGGVVHLRHALDGGTDGRPVGHVALGVCNGAGGVAEEVEGGRRAAEDADGHASVDEPPHERRAEEAGRAGDEDQAVGRWGHRGRTAGPAQSISISSSFFPTAAPGATWTAATAPAAAARSSFSIFIASSTTSPCPSSTASPG